MRQKGPIRFGAAKSEAITILVTPISVGAFCAAAHGGKPLVDISPTKKHFKYVFKITKSVGKTEHTTIAMQFMGKEPSTARYEIELSGGGGGNFNLDPITKPSGAGPAERSLNLRFEVE